MIFSRHNAQYTRLYRSGSGRRPLVAALPLLLGILVLGPAALPASPAAAARLAMTVPFPGPSRGMPVSRAPRATDFTDSCNASVNTAGGTVGGTVIMTGTAVTATSGCGVATLMLASPGAGRFTAAYGVSDGDTTGAPSRVRVRVIGLDGSDIRVTQFSATRGHSIRIDVDVSKSSAIELNFLDGPTTFIYGFGISGSARVLTPARGSGSALPAGAAPVDMAGAAYSCNAAKATATTPLTVTLVGIATAGSATSTSCGQITFTVAPYGPSTLVLRYGLDDRSTGGAITLSARVLDAGGRLLRKAVGAPFVGAGLQALWVDLSNAHTVVLAVDGATSSTIVVTAVGILSRSLPTYTLPNHTISGGSPSGSAVIDPHVFVSKCNSGIGADDVTVAHTPVLAGTYLATFSCGSTSMVFCCTTTRGAFHALFGVPDNASASASAGRPTATVVIKDKDNRVLRQITVHASYGAAGVPLNISVDRASELSISFLGDSAVLYNLRISGTATVSQLIYAPTAPPVMAPGGVAVNPHDFIFSCNASVATADQRLVGATSLEGWALAGTDCGQATLTLTGRTYPHHTFYARVGIALAEPPSTVVTLRFSVLAGGRVIRAQDVIARYGFGPLPVRMNLAGGTTLQITWAHVVNLSNIVVYGMTLT